MGKKRRAIKKAEQTDIAVTRSVADFRHRKPVEWLGAVGELGDQPPLIAFAAMIMAAGAVRRSRAVIRTGAHVLAAHLGATLVKSVIKRSVDRTRPHLLVEEGRYEVGPGRRNEGPYNSFPSGHTAGAVAVARALVRREPDLAPYAYAAAGVIAAVQIPKCNHFVSDIAAGAAIGWAAEAAAASLLDDQRGGTGEQHASSPGG